MGLLRFRVRTERLHPNVVGFAETAPGGAAFVWSYLLHDADSAVLVDAGVSHTAAAVRSWFAQHGMPPSRLRAILLTHGHSDHIQGVSELVRWAHVPVYLHRADRAVAAGSFEYRGWGRIGGALEALGRIAFDCRPLRQSSPLAEGQEFPWFGGLRVVELPGHTPGHVGFLAPKLRLLFCGDAVLHLGRLAFPHRFFNTDRRAVAASVVRLLDFDVDRIFPMHHWGIHRNLQTDIRALVEAARKKRAGAAAVPSPADSP